MNLKKIEDWLPIRKNEWIHFAQITAIGFLIAVIYFLLRILKDTLINTHPSMGTEAIPILKLWIILPTMIGASLAYKKLSKHFSQKLIFQFSVVTIICYFLLFALFLQESSLTNFPQAPFIIRYWSYSLFYLFSELWGTVVLMVLFWGMVNRITPPEQAKRFYGPLLFICNFASVVAGKGSLILQQSLNPSTPWTSICRSYIFLIALMALILLCLHSRLTDKNFQESKTAPQTNLKNTLPSIAKGLTVTVFCFYFCSSMMEILWQSKLSELYPNPKEFYTYLSHASIAIGIGSSFGALLVTTRILQYLPWKVMALTTPLSLFSLLFLFFGSDNLEKAVFFGAIYHVLGRILKYVVFDPSKELAFTNLSRKEQIETKPIVDGVAPHLGKSTESLVLTGCVTATGQLTQAFPALFCLLIIAKLSWCFCTTKLQEPRKKEFIF